MHINEFKQVVKTFSDPESEFLIEGSKFLMSANDQIIEAELSRQSGDVFVNEGDGPIPASKWIVNKLARLPSLAHRIRETVGNTPHFVPPVVSLLSSLEVRPEETIVHSDDGANIALEALTNSCVLETTILYITSDAGEGKTSLIGELARAQAERYLSGEADWLLVPIPLGGRHFLRFDDITVGALQNRYRFSALYYDSFLALVRMGVIIPAFDGFEEMFVEGSSGEALSAMGILVANLDSMGAMVIAARKAYFEFENLKTQERLYDTISDYRVGFARLEINRWGKPQFIQYCINRGVVDPEVLYERVSERLESTHSLLTRPVLVRRLVDIAIKTATLDEFLKAVHSSGSDFFSVFVRGIIEREANEKWLDRSGEVGMSLLTVDEHCQLLSQVAVAMWDARVDYLKQDLLEFVADYFCENRRKTPPQAQQIRERLRGHALLILSQNAKLAVEFDHEEFRHFFLGEGLAEQLKPMDDKARGEMLSFLRKGLLPRHSERAFMRAIIRDKVVERLDAAKFLLEIAALDGQASFTQQNCSSLVLRLLKNVDGGGLLLEDLAFGSDVLRDRNLKNLEFRKCYFAPTSLETSQLIGCSFVDCNFVQLRIYGSTKVVKSSLSRDTKIDSIQFPDREVDIWDPAVIRSESIRSGFTWDADETPSGDPDFSPEVQSDDELKQCSKLIRYFMRSTHISESIMAIKLGNSAQHFLDEEVPRLLEVGLLAEIENRGAGGQRRFKLGLPLEVVNQITAKSNGSYERFLVLAAKA